MSVLAGMPVAWLLARAAGLVAFGVLTLSVWLGLAMSTRLVAPRSAPACWDGTARSPGPGSGWSGSTSRRCLPTRRSTSARPRRSCPSPRRGARPPSPPAWSRAGSRSRWRRRSACARLIGQRGWRRLHYASFVAFVLAFCHALASGTDLAGLGGPIVAAVAGGPVLFGSLARILTPPRPRREAPP